jgi:ligand-binding sensor domain-containing protein/signal transduction histidine kinase
LGPRTRAAAIAGVALAIAPPAFALDPDKGLSECTVQAWHVRDGLPGGWVRGLAQTPDGYLWIATVGGLARLDGAAVETVPADGPLSRLADIIGIGLARDGTLWVLPSFGEPVCRRGRNLAACSSDRLAAAGYPRPYVVTEAPDPAGAVWLAAREGIFRQGGGKLTLVHPPAALPFGRPNDLHADARGRLWVAAAEGLFLQDGARFQLHAGAAGPLTASAHSFFESPRGHLWVATAGALVRIDVATGATTALPAPFSRPTQLIEDRDGNVWIGTLEGLVRFREGRFDHFTTRDGLPEDHVVAVFEDREGSLWVGTRSSGLAQFTDRTLGTRAGPPSLRHWRVDSVAEDAEGALWVGSARGLHRWRGGEERTYQVADGLPGNNVTAILPAGETLWVGTDRGLARLREGRFDRPGAFDSAISALFIDGRGTLWVGSDEGLGRLRGDRVELVPPQGGFDPGPVRGIQEDPGGTIWVVTGGGLARVEGEGLVRARTPSNLNLRVARAIHRDPSGTLWIGTARGGVVRVKDGELRGFADREGVAFEQLYQILTDDQGFLWIGSGRGILRLDRAALDQVARGERQRVDPVWFDADDNRRDVSATRPRQPGAWKTRDGRLWFATDQGLVTIDPRRVRLNAVPPPVWIERVEVDGRPASRQDPHRFPAGAGTLEIHFAAVTLLEPKKVAHRYRLEGFDRRWVDAGTRRVAYYTNLSPGHYRFRVQARNADGIWNEEGASVALELAPHFYQTVWFYGLCLVAVAGLVLSAHRTRLARVRAQYQAVLAERARLARELHDSLLQGMSAVALQIYGLRKRLGPSAPPRAPETIARDLEVIEEVVTANLEETRRYVWDLRERAQGDDDLDSALARLVRRLSADRPEECRATVEGKPVPLPEGIRSELVRIAQEAVTNALRHANARHIEVRTCYEGGGVVLSVSDDGRGFQPEDAPGARSGHFGMVGMRERAARLGRFEVDSRPGQGTTVTVTVSAETASRDV